jgi:hypothetical protein
MVLLPAERGAQRCHDAPHMQGRGIHGFNGDIGDAQEPPALLAREGEPILYRRIGFGLR